VSDKRREFGPGLMDIPGLFSGIGYLESELVELLKGEVETKRRAYGVHCEAESTALARPPC
jgi:hypothetical protein